MVAISDLVSNIYLTTQLETTASNRNAENVSKPKR